MTTSWRDVERTFKRGPQIVTRKDASVIVGATGLQPDWRCLDLGGGSGFLALFLAHLVPHGHVVCYEKKNEHAAVIAENIARSGLTNITLIEKPAEEFSEQEFDLITADMKGIEHLAEKCYGALKPNGFLCVYSPHIEQQIAVRQEMEKAGFRDLATLETIQREWKISHGISHPVYGEISHTGFVTVGRK